LRWVSLERHDTDSTATRSCPPERGHNQDQFEQVPLARAFRGREAITASARVRTARGTRSAPERIERSEIRDWSTAVGWGGLWRGCGAVAVYGQAIVVCATQPSIDTNPLLNPGRISVTISILRQLPAHMNH
jgi:hypothetical protein